METYYDKNNRMTVCIEGTLKAYVNGHQLDIVQIRKIKKFFTMYKNKVCKYGHKGHWIKEIQQCYCSYPYMPGHICGNSISKHK